MMLLVRLAPGVLMVVLSSTAIKELVTRKKVRANSVPFSVLKASMFITSTRKQSTLASICSMATCSALRGDADQHAMAKGM